MVGGRSNENIPKANVDSSKDYAQNIEIDVQFSTSITRLEEGRSCQDARGEEGEKVLDTHDDLEASEREKKKLARERPMVLKSEDKCVRAARTSSQSAAGLIISPERTAHA